MKLLIAIVLFFATPQCPLCADAKSEPFDTLKSLVGKWESDAGPDGKKVGIEFKLIAGGSCLAETAFPGAAHEMMNMYCPDGDRLVMTHYCAAGSQPRMKLVSSENGVMKFEYLDATNLKNRDEGHMDSLTLTITADKLTEDWGYYADGKEGERVKFELHRAK